MLVSHRSVSFSSALFCTALLSSLVLPPLCHAKSAEPVVDEATLSVLEQKATTAPPREQPILFTELADRLTSLAAQQIQSGNIDQASATLDRVEKCAERIQNDVNAKSKDLKKAEMKMHDTERRLRDMVRMASLDVKPRVQQTLKRLNDAQKALLNLMFMN